MTFAFPGMDPYLEHHDLWSDVHSRLITALADAITPLLPPPYYAAVETRSYVADPEALLLAGRPDLLIGHEREAPPPPTVEQTAVAGAGFAEGVIVELPAPDVARETYLEVREPPGDEAIVVLEILSPDNKQPGEGRRQYQAKRRRVFDSLTHFVEIDLLRGGQRFPYRVRNGQAAGTYAILVSRADDRPFGRLYPFELREPIPVFPLPLKTGDPAIPVELGSVLREVYERARYARRIRYQSPPPPGLSDEDLQWVDERLHAAGLR